MLAIILDGRVPSKKNEKIMVCRGPRPMLYPSKDFTAWHKKALVSVNEQVIGKGLVEDIDMITIEFLMPDKRKTDLTNKAESIMDLLVDAGVIEDDSYLHVPKIVLKGEYMKGVARAFINIYGKKI